MERDNNKNGSWSFRHLIPQDTRYYDSGDALLITTADQAQSFIDLAHQRNISHIGLYILCSQKNVNNINLPREIIPAYLSVTLAEQVNDHKIKIYSAVIDLGENEIINLLQDLFMLQICFVGHEIKKILFNLWNLKLREPLFVWDTMICEKALCLGKFDCRSSTTTPFDKFQEIKNREDIRRTEQKYLTLEASCNRACRKS